MDSSGDTYRLILKRLVLNLSMMSNIDRLMDILACPKCKGEVNVDRESEEITCNDCRLKFAIEDDIPNMLLEDAESF